MSHTPYDTKPIHGDGTQMLYRFENGFGASVVQHRHSYGSAQGKWELAVLQFEGDEWNITYDTEVAGDVVGWLDQSEVEAHLDQIAALGSESSVVAAKPEVKMHDWQILGDRLYGLAEDHPELGTRRITTSTIQNVDHAANTVETRNTIYRLVGAGKNQAAA